MRNEEKTGKQRTGNWEWEMSFTSSFSILCFLFPAHQFHPPAHQFDLVPWPFPVKILPFPNSFLRSVGNLSSTKNPNKDRKARKGVPLWQYASESMGSAGSDGTRFAFFANEKASRSLPSTTSRTRRHWPTC